MGKKFVCIECGSEEDEFQAWQCMYCKRLMCSDCDDEYDGVCLDCHADRHIPCSDKNEE